jgi:hypothetical protein
MREMVVHLGTLAPDLAPTPGEPARSWWADDPRTRAHAQHCLPLLMANRLGHVIRSPGRFQVSWSGNFRRAPRIEVLDDSGVVVDAHTGAGTFVVQPGFVVSTTQVDDFVMVRPVPNVRGAWFSAMEALIEAWWQTAEFGVVCLLQRPGLFVVERGEPLAQMCVYQAAGGEVPLRVRDGLPDATLAWRRRRAENAHRRTGDYVRGRRPDGTREPTHRTGWRPPGSGPRPVVPSPVAPSPTSPEEAP